MTSPCTSPVPPPCPPLKGTYHPCNQQTYADYADIYGTVAPPPSHYGEVTYRTGPPNPPQRTVSFLEQQRLPQKISAYQPEVQSQSFHARTVSCTEYASHPPTDQADHARSKSSPAPLSPPLGLVPPPLGPPDHVVIDIEEDKAPDLPLPPPPYIS